MFLASDLDDRHRLMSIRPLHAYVLVRDLPPDDKTAGGLHIPDAARGKSLHGIVEGLGTGYRDHDGQLVNLDVELAQEVLFADNVGHAFEIEGVKYHLLHEEMVLGVVERWH